MRTLALAAALTATVAVGGCGDDETSTDVVPKTVPTVTAPEQSGIPAQTTGTDPASLMAAMQAAAGASDG